MPHLRLRGLVAAPHTPFKPNGELSLGVVRAQARLLENNDVRGAFICGTTGEGSSLTDGERRLVAEAWAKERRAPLALIVHVGHLNLSVSCDLARHAQQIGADAIAAIAPFFFKPSGAAELVDWCARIAKSAPKLPFYYYHIPALTSVNIPVADFIRRAHGRIPTLAGIKFTDGDLMAFSQAMTASDGRYELLFGRDEVLLAALALGAVGAVGSTYNFAAPVYNGVIKAFAAGRIAEARRCQRKAVAMIGALNRHGGLSAGKAVMKFLGVDCGPVRPPLHALTRAEEGRLRSDLRAAGFFSFASRTPS
jgi:N-acetylneuraminate lyase